ncbi:MAG TPA: DUF1345 domain-containing protein [Acetobacteraceae bacterium]|jgi:uncharacterized membrane protein|nr:DUF1345 domain-containing protein [Acetobacteraceae bacterium]
MLSRSWRAVRARPFLFIALLLGLVAYQVLPSTLSHTTRSIIAWDIGVIAFLTLAAYLFASEHLDRMAADAAAQEEGEWTIFWLTVAAVTFSFVAIIGEFAGITKDMPPPQRTLRLALVAITLLVSWLMTHTTFAFRYAHEFYQVAPDGSGISGGLEFPGEKRPDYLDFMYFALVLGMTFQVSDVQITARKFRRLAAAHGLLGFLYNAIIVALTVNLAAGLL